MKAKFMFSLICVAAVTLTACEEYPYGYYSHGSSPYGYYPRYGYGGSYGYPSGGYGYGGGYGYPSGGYGYGGGYCYPSGGYVCGCYGYSHRRCCYARLAVASSGSGSVGGSRRVTRRCDG